MPQEDEYQKSVQLKFRYCLVLEYHNSFDSPNNSRSFNLSFCLNALITFRVITTKLECYTDDLRATFCEGMII